MEFPYLQDDAVKELATLNQLHDDVVVVGVVLEELVHLDYVRVIQVPQNPHLTETGARNSTKANQYCYSRQISSKVTYDGYNFESGGKALEKHLLRTNVAAKQERFVTICSSSLETGGDTGRSHSL